MECHRCPHAEAVRAGKYRGRAYEETPCAACELRESSAFTLEFDDARATAAGGEPAGVASCWEASEPETCLPVSVMSEAVVELLRLAPATRDVVCMRYQGMPYREIANRQGVTIAAAELRHRRAMKKWPALRALFAEKAAKQRRRKPYARGTRTAAVVSRGNERGFSGEFGES